MARYILALILLLAGGLVLVALNCDSVNTTQQRVDLEELKVVTRSVYLTQFEEPRAYSLVNFSWAGSDADLGKELIVERSSGNDFLVQDTVALTGSAGSFSDPDSLSAGLPVNYRFLSFDQGRASVVNEFECDPLEPIKFLIPDTVVIITDQSLDKKPTRSIVPGEDQARVHVLFLWEPLTSVQIYSAEIMSLKSLAPLPDGEVLVKGEIKSTDKNNIVWDIDTDKLVPGKSYILKVKAQLPDEHGSRTTEGYRLFVLSGVSKTSKTS